MLLYNNSEDARFFHEFTGTINHSWLTNQNACIDFIIVKFLLSLWLWLPRRQIQKQMSLKWCNNIKAATALIWVSCLFLTAVNQAGHTKKGKNKSTFFYFDESSEKLKKLEKFLILSFSWEVKYSNNLRKLTWVISGRNPKKTPPYLRKMWL